jgi:hypothetical protein
MESTSIAGLKGMFPACFEAARQLMILSSPLNGNRITRAIRSKSGA